VHKKYVLKLLFLAYDAHMSDNIKDRLKAARKGEGIAVRDLRALGRKLTDVLALIEELHERGCYVVLKSSGIRSDKDGIRMVRSQLHLLNKGAARRVAKANGGKGGRTKEYIPNATDKAIWRDTVEYRTNNAASKAIGWSVSTIERAYGKSGRAKSGRPKKAKQ
jgi:DNA invertase Pin-like site-specific DNA recombinase